MQPLLGTTVAQFVVGILAVFAAAVIAACGGEASPITATSQPTALNGIGRSTASHAHGTIANFR